MESAYAARCRYVSPPVDLKNMILTNEKLLKAQERVESLLPTADTKILNRFILTKCKPKFSGQYLFFGYGN